MSDDKVNSFQPPGQTGDPLTEVLRNGARRLLEQTIEAEVEAFLASHAEERTADGRRRLVRHGHGPEREILTGIGPVPVLYPRGLSIGDFRGTLSALMAAEAPALSPQVLGRLKSEWAGEYERWQQRDLSARRYVYLWADGVYLQGRLEDEAHQRNQLGASFEHYCVR